MFWIWSTRVLASVTHIGVSISRIGAQSIFGFKVHRDGFMFDGGPIKGPRSMAEGKSLRIILVDNQLCGIAAMDQK